MGQRQFSLAVIPEGFGDVVAYEVSARANSQPPAERLSLVLILLTS
jgi:hypothetical protein